MLSYNDTTEKPSPERSRAEASLSIHIKESLFKYLFIYRRSMFKKTARRIYTI